MKMTWSWGKRIRHLLAITLTLLGLYLLVGTLYFVAARFSAALVEYQQVQEGQFQELPQTCQDEPGVHFYEHLLEESSPPLTRTVIISATSAGVILDFQLAIPATHGLAEQVTNGVLDFDRDAIACGSFGELNLNGRRLTDSDYTTTTWTLDPTSNVLSFRLEARQPNDYSYYGVTIQLTRPFPEAMPQARRDELIVAFDDHQLVSVEPMPDQVTPNLVVLTNKANQPLDQVRISLRPTVNEVTIAETTNATPSDPETRRTFLQRLSQSAIQLDLLSSLLLAVLEALPLFIFCYLVLRRRHMFPSLTASLVRTTIVVLLFHFIIIVLTRSSGLFADISNQLVETISPGLPIDGLRIEPYQTVPILIGVLLPALLWQKRVLPLPLRDLPASCWRRLADFLLFSLLLLSAVASALFVGENEDVYFASWGWSLPDNQLEFITPLFPLVNWPFRFLEAEFSYQTAWFILVTSMISLLIWGLLEMLYRQFALQRPRPNVIATAVFLIISLALIDSYLMVLSGQIPFKVSLIWLAGIIGLSTALVWAVGAVIWAQVTKIDRERLKPRSLDQLAVPAPELPPPTVPAPPPPPPPESPLPHWVQRLFWIVALILTLWQLGRPQVKTAPDLPEPLPPCTAAPIEPSIIAPPRSTPTKWIVPRWIWGLLVLLAVLLSIPMEYLFSSRRSIYYLYDVISMAYQLDDLLLLIWLGGLVWLLYWQGQTTEPKLNPSTRLVGLLAASSLLFSPTAHWLFIPIRFILGWYLLSWFIRPVAYWQTLHPFFNQVVTERRELLDRIVDLNIAQDAYEKFRKNLNKKLSEGEETFTSFDAKVEARRQELDQLYEKSRVNQRSAKEVALTFGPYPSAWQNGLHGAKWALLFASPWIFLFLPSFFNSPLIIFAYPLWQFTIELLNVVATWAAFGFIFGYFYPYLWGQNGLEKGFGLFIVAVVPWLPLMILNNATISEWQASLFWMLQVFIHCMLLGLVAFDYAVLRQGRYNWQMLFEVHGITWVGVSVTSILIAIGTTITTLLTSQATNLVTLALNFIIPQIQSAPIPPTPTPGPF